jgi:hypothetical protein
MRATYNGDTTVVFAHYLDVSKPEARTTLEAEPGKTYDIKQADAPWVIQKDGQFTDQELAMPPDGDWTETSDPTWAEVEAKEAATGGVQDVGEVKAALTAGEHVVDGRTAKRVAKKIEETS